MNPIDSTADDIDSLAADFLTRHHDGESPDIESYVAKYPQHAETIRDLFPMIAALENLKQGDRKEAARVATTRPLELKQLGDFQILREIGRGGMGIVYEAIQRSLKRRVALKILPKQALLDPQQLQRFRREARTAAQLHHTHLVSLYGAGEEDGFHFLVMELVDGASLDKVIPALRAMRDGEQPSGDQCRQDIEMVQRVAASLFQKPEQIVPPSVADTQFDFDLRNSESEMPANLHHSTDKHDVSSRPRFNNQRRYFRNVAAIARDAANALQHAHDKGVLHRDIKPGNLILDPQRNIWVSDFGLARQTTGGDETETKTFGGTAAYLPPEFFDGKVDQRSDIYALGLTIYELLTLQPAFADASPGETMKRVASGSFEPVPPRNINRQIPADLQTVLLNCLANQPNHRYATAVEVATDLQRFLDGRPLKAKRTRALEHIRRWCLRNKAIAALSATAAALVMVIAGVMTANYFQAMRSNRAINAALVREVQQRERSDKTLMLATAALDQIYSNLSPGDLQDYETAGSNLDGAAPVLSGQTAAVLDDLIEFYDRLAEQGGSREDLSQSSIRATERMGDIHRQLGRLDDAMRHYESAIATIDAISEPGNDDAYTIEKARLYNQLGRISYILDDGPALTKAHRTAIKILDDANSQSDQGQEPLTYELARAEYYLGRAKPESAAGVSSHHLHGRPPDRRQPLPEGGQAPGVPGEGIAARRERIKHLERSIEILSTRTGESDPNPAWQFLKACCLRELALADSGSGADHAIEQSKLSESLLKDLVERFPSNPAFKFELVETLRTQCILMAMPSVDVDAAGEILERALALADTLVREHPNVPAYGLSRMHVLQSYGHILTRGGRRDQSDTRPDTLTEARSWLVKAQQQMDQLVSHWPFQPSYRLWAIVVDASIAQVDLDRDQPEIAIESLRDASEHFEELSRNMNDFSIEVQLPEIRDALFRLARRSRDGDLIEQFSQ